MPALSQIVVLGPADHGQPAEDDVLAALAPRFSVQRTGRSRTVRRAWLDTFDWRLHRAGFTLEYVTGRRPAELVLTGPAGHVVTQPASRLSWPALAAGLPAAPVRDRLCATAGIRALLPAARAASTVRELRVLNEDAKTIAWLTVDNTAVSYPAAAQLPARLEVSAVRGYQPQADRVTQLLAAAAGPAWRGRLPAGRGPGRGRAARRGLQQQAGHPAVPGHAGPAGAAHHPAGPTGHHPGQRAGHAPRHRHRVPARPAGGGAPHPVRAQAGRATCCPPGWRPGSPPSSSGSATSPRPPVTWTSTCSATRTWRTAWCRPSRPSWPRSTTTWSASAAPSTAGWSAGCARPGSPG